MGKKLQDFLRYQIQTVMMRLQFRLVQRFLNQFNENVRLKKPDIGFFFALLR